MMIDTHVHVIAPLNDAAHPRAPSAATTDWVVSNAIDVDQLWRRMRSSSVDKAVLVQAITAHQFDNSYTADAARRTPREFTSVGGLDHTADGAADTLRMWVRDRGIHGARLRPSTTQPLDDDRTAPVWQAVEELGIPVLVVGLNYSLYPQLIGVLDKHPTVKVALDHLAGVKIEGGPPFASAQPLLALARYSNVYLKYSPTTYEACATANVELHQFIGALVDSFGAERLLWGSNYPAHHEPAWTYRSIADTARSMAAHFSERDRNLMLGEASLALWPELK